MMSSFESEVSASRENGPSYRPARTANVGFSPKFIHAFSIVATVVRSRRPTLSSFSSVPYVATPNALPLPLKRTRAMKKSLLASAWSYE
jgi:hypothetical protein